MKASAVWMLLATVALPACRYRVAPFPPQQRGPVTVTVACPNSGGVPSSVTATVAPWRAAVAPLASGEPDGIRWNLAGEADSLWITPRDPDGAWPFERKRFVGTRSAPARSGRLTTQPSPDRIIFYRVTARCGGITVMIDPELIFPPT